MTVVRCGIDVLARAGFAPLKGLRVGAILNPTSVDASFAHTADLLASAPDVRLGALFGPEHGVRGEAQYMEAVGDVAADRATGIPVYSLYGSTFESLTPRPEWLSSLDALVFDIQDVGSRYYTYVYTMALAMRAAARAKLKFFVLDRPNPLGLTLVEGNTVEAGFTSFVGLYPLPNRHGMTAGELAQLFKAHDGLSLDLQVIACEGLGRSTHWGESGRVFIPPSPNMPTPDTALVYPGMCFFEGTNVSEGRGTTRPFEQCGAPWVDGRALATKLNAAGLAGVRFRAVAFTPTFDKFKGQSCEGVFIHVLDATAFRPVACGLAIISALKTLWPDRFAWRADAYEFVDSVPAFDLLAGNARVRAGLEQGRPWPELVAEFPKHEAEFVQKRASSLLYS